MSVLAVTDSHTFWTVALGIGAVVIVVVIVVMALLLSFLRDVGSSVSTLLHTGEQIAENTSAIAQLSDTAAVLELIKDEALIHDGYLRSQLS